MFREKLDSVLKSAVFLSWKEKNPDFFLAHAFIVEDTDWQFGFYNPSSEKMVTFVCGDTILHGKEEDILKSQTKISELDPSEVKIDLIKAKKIAADLIKEEYNDCPVSKSFVIIQNIDKKTVFNMTFLAQNFNTINLKIDAKDGTVIHHSSQVIASF